MLSCSPWPVIGAKAAGNEVQATAENFHIIRFKVEHVYIYTHLSSQPLYQVKDALPLQRLSDSLVRRETTKTLVQSYCAGWVCVCRVSVYTHLLSLVTTTFLLHLPKYLGASHNMQDFLLARLWVQSWIKLVQQLKSWCCLMPFWRAVPSEWVGSNPWH